MIHVGDKVKIAVTGAVYNTYLGFFEYYRQCGASTLTERVCSQYEYSRTPSAEDTGKVFTVMFVREHGSLGGRNLAIINDGNITYIIDVAGLTLVSSVMPFEVGDKVYIKDSGPIYSMWEGLIKNMLTAVPDGEEVYRKWARNQSPSGNELGGKSPEAIFTVKWVGHHVARPDEATIAIISNDRSTYIIGVKGLAKVGENSWDKYIIYVRNWAVINKETAQSVRDAAGPKLYAEWLSDRK